MIDWLTVETPDPVGIPVNAGEIMRVGRDGEIEWVTPARLNVEGSFRSNMTFRALGSVEAADDDLSRAQWELGKRSIVSTGQWAAKERRKAGLEISGNPQKWLYGHNLFGTDDLRALLVEVVTKAKSAIWPDLFEAPEIELGEGLISRIDLTGSWLLERASDVKLYLKALEEYVWVPIRGRGVMDRSGTTLYYGSVEEGKRASDWALKLYSKGHEITANRLPECAYQVPGLLDEVNRTIRVELTLRTAELKRLGLRKVSDWNPEKVREVWTMYVSKLDFAEAKVNLDTADLGELGLKPRHVHAIAAWKAGNDLRAGMKESSFYRLRKELRELTGYDIKNQCPKSNVVPLRREVIAVPARFPDWADLLTEALSRAA